MTAQPLKNGTLSTYQLMLRIVHERHERHEKIESRMLRASCASSQAPAWEFSTGSSSFPARKAGALLTGFPSGSLGTSVSLSATRKCSERCAAPRVECILRTTSKQRERHEKNRAPYVSRFTTFIFPILTMGFTYCSCTRFFFVLFVPFVPFVDYAFLLGTGV